MSKHKEQIERLRSDLTKMARLAHDQLDRALACFHTQDLAQAEEIVERDDVIDNLNFSVEEQCFDLAAGGALAAEELRMVRAAAKVGLNLERAADAGTHIAKRVRLIHRDGVTPAPFSFQEVEELALRGLHDASQAFLQRDLTLAREACLREPELDASYVPCLQRLTGDMQEHPAQIPYLMHCASVLKYLEKVADYALNVGEQTIFAITGRRLKFAQYQQLDRLIGGAAPEAIAFRPYWDGISGAVVARLEGRDEPIIYKEGSRRKIQAEVEKLEAWQHIDGQLTPRVLGSVSLKDRQALLREYVEGTLLSDLYLSLAPREVKLTATQRLLDILRRVWAATLAPTAARVDYVAQIRRRLPEVYALHPELTTPVHDLDGVSEVELQETLDLAEHLQASLAPAFSVWLHGDFNANNVVYRQETGQIRLIDVYRSQPGDYLQDVDLPQAADLLRRGYHLLRLAASGT